MSIASSLVSPHSSWMNSRDMPLAWRCVDQRLKLLTFSRSSFHLRKLWPFADMYNLHDSLLLIFISFDRLYIDSSKLIILLLYGIILRQLHVIVNQHHLTEIVTYNSKRKISGNESRKVFIIIFAGSAVVFWAVKASIVQYKNDL